MFGLHFKHALAEDVHTPHHWLEMVIEGNDAEKPAAEIAGRLYWATDTHILYIDNSVSWLEVFDYYWNDVRGDAKIVTHTGVSSAHHIKTIPGITFNLGLATVGTKQAQALIPSTFIISLVKIYSDVAPTGASLIVDVNKNGVTIFTTQANRPQIPIDGHSDDSGSPDVITLAAGDRVSIDVDQVGSVISGGDDLVVVVVGA